MSYWFTIPIIKLLVPLGNTSAAKGLGTTFNVPKMFIGVNSIPEQGGGVVNAISPLCKNKRVFIITDTTVRQFGERVSNSFKTAKFTTEIWDGTLPEIPVNNIKLCAEAMKTFEPDLIAAVGGGSVMDMAKAAWILYERPDITDIRTVMLFGPALGLRKKAILLAIPTTSGTGSEVTTATVITDEENQRKVPLASSELLPDFVALDPTFTMGMPPKLTAGTGLDALAHAIDDATSNASSDFTDAMALRAIELVFKYLPRAFHDGKDHEARLKMHIAASMAGIAFGNGTASLTHSLGHSLGKVLHIHHGISVGLFIPYTQQYYSVVSDRFLDVCKVLEIKGRTRENKLENLIDAVKQLMKELEIPTNLKDMGITEEQLKTNMPKMVRESIEDPDTFGSPQWLTEANCEKLFWYAYEGKDVDF